MFSFPQLFFSLLSHILTKFHVQFFIYDSPHFSYFEIEDIPYFNTPTPYTELFAKSTFEQGQILDALVSLNLTPEYNFTLAHKGYKSLGKYQSTRSRGNQFRFSSNYSKC